MKKITALFTFSLLIILYLPTFGQQEQKLPSISITNLKGEKVDISTIQKDGKVIVMDFWATWCVPCKKELTNISEMYGDWKKKYNMELVAVSIDDARNTAKVKTYVDGSGWDYNVLVDANQDLKRALNFQNVPYTIVIDQKGNIVYTHDGYVDGDEFLLEAKIKELTGK